MLYITLFISYIYCDIFTIDKTIVRRKILEKVPPNDWRGNSIKEMFDILDGVLNIDFDYNEIVEIIEYVCTI